MLLLYFVALLILLVTKLINYISIHVFSLSVYHRNVNDMPVFFNEVERVPVHSGSPFNYTHI